MATYPFFAASRNALDAITRLYDFVWPTAAAIWNLRWQVAGYQQVRGGTTTVEELRARFVEGSGIHGANLHRACLEHTWDQQKADLAFVALVNLFAAYESWAANLVEEMQPTLPKGFNAEKALQFPSATDKKGNPSGVRVAIQKLIGTKSNATETELQPVLARQSGVDPKHLDEMLIVYRYFKECRNCLMHVGGSANENALAVSTEVGALDPNALPFKIPDHASLVLNAPVNISLYGAVGFSDIMRRLILTIDSELAASSTAEVILRARWRSEFGIVQLPADAKKRHSAIARRLTQLGIPRVPTTMALEQALKADGLVR